MRPVANRPVPQIRYYRCDNIESKMQERRSTSGGEGNRDYIVPAGIAPLKPGYGPDAGSTTPKRYSPNP